MGRDRQQQEHLLDLPPPPLPSALPPSRRGSAAGCRFLQLYFHRLSLSSRLEFGQISCSWGCHYWLSCFHTFWHRNAGGCRSLGWPVLSRLQEKKRQRHKGRVGESPPGNAIHLNISTPQDHPQMSPPQRRLLLESWSGLLSSPLHRSLFPLPEHLCPASFCSQAPDLHSCFTEKLQATLHTLGHFYSSCPQTTSTFFRWSCSPFPS